MKISIIGLGWYGHALAQRMSKQHDISGTTRSTAKLQELPLVKTVEILDITNTPSKKLLDSDVVVLNIPPFKNQLEWFKSWKWNLNTHLIFISSTSVYGELQGVVNEETLPFPSTENGKILFEEEKWVKSFSNYTVIRFAGLIGPGRHPGKFLSGRTNLAAGNSPVNLIHLDDCIGFTELVIETKIVNETFNLVAPNHPTRREYYTSHCEHSNLPIPDFVDSDDISKIVSHEKVSKIYKSRNV